MRININQSKLEVRSWNLYCWMMTDYTNQPTKLGAPASVPWLQARGDSEIPGIRSYKLLCSALHAYTVFEEIQYTAKRPNDKIVTAQHALVITPAMVITQPWKYSFGHESMRVKYTRHYAKNFKCSRVFSVLCGIFFNLRNPWRKGHYLLRQTWF